MSGGTALVFDVTRREFSDKVESGVVAGAVGIDGLLVLDTAPNQLPKHLKSWFEYGVNWFYGTSEFYGTQVTMLELCRDFLPKKTADSKNLFASVPAFTLTPNIIEAADEGLLKKSFMSVVYSKRQASSKKTIDELNAAISGQAGLVRECFGIILCLQALCPLSDSEFIRSRFLCAVVLLTHCTFGYSGLDEWVDHVGAVWCCELAGRFTELALKLPKATVPADFKSRMDGLLNDLVKDLSSGISAWAPSTAPPATVLSSSALSVKDKANKMIADHRTSTGVDPDDLARMADEADSEGLENLSLQLTILKLESSGLGPSTDRLATVASADAEIKVPQRLVLKGSTQNADFSFNAGLILTHFSKTLNIGEIAGRAKDLFSFGRFSIDSVRSIVAARAAANERDVLFDVSRIIVLAISRGTSLLKIKQNSSDEGKAEITSLIRIYKLSSSKSGDRTGTTLSRICQISPVMTMVISCELSGITRPGAFHGNEFLGCQATSCFIAPTPSASEHKDEAELRKYYWDYLEQFDRTINPGTWAAADGSTMKLFKDRQVQYWSLAYNSSGLSKFSSAWRLCLLMAIKAKNYVLAAACTEKTSADQDKYYSGLSPPKRSLMTAYLAAAAPV